MTLHINLSLGSVLITLGIISIPILCIIFGDCKDSGGYLPPIPLAIMFFTLVIWAVLILVYVILG